jgi:hypothetical protein
MKRVKRPHGLLPKAPQKGDKITVIVEGVAMQTLVRRSTGARKIEHGRAKSFRISGSYLGTKHGGTVYRKDEGISWARGWDTKEADALRVAVAL